MSNHAVSTNIDLRTARVHPDDFAFVRRLMLDVGCSMFTPFPGGNPTVQHRGWSTAVKRAVMVGLLLPWLAVAADSQKGSSHQEHWAFKPLSRPPIPQPRQARRVRNPVDCFILQRLEQAGLGLSTDADRATLIRRVYFDLIGLPPSPDAVAGFVNDRSPDAYERVVNRLLVSPGYGERWARHWLDVVRFAESNGFETNTERKNAWPYRDYVIRSFNEDKPYNQFIREQLAGDALGADEATGFLVAGPWDAVKSPDIQLTMQQRMDELHDIVSTAGMAFLGLTVGCARCHDHKYDPISQRDYYAMQAVFAGVQHGERTLRPLDAEARLHKADLRKKELAKIEAQLGWFEPLAQPGFNTNDTPTLPLPVAGQNVLQFEAVQAQFVRFTIHETLNYAEPCLDEFEIYSAEENPRNLALASAGAKASASGTFPNFPMHKLEHLNDGRYGNAYSWIANQAGKAWVQIELPVPSLFNKIVWSRDREGEFSDRLPLRYTIEIATLPEIWEPIAGKLKLRPAVHPRHNTERFQPVKAKLLRFTILKASSLEPCIDELEVFTAEEHPRNIALASVGTKALASGTFPDSDIHKLEHVNDGRYGNSRSWISNEPGKGWIELEFPEEALISRLIWGRDREEKFSDRLALEYKIEVATNRVQWQLMADSTDREAFQQGAKPRLSANTSGLTPRELNRLAQLVSDKQAGEQQIKALTSFPVVYAGKFEKPEPTHRLHRGEPSQKREAITPGAIDEIGPPLTLLAEAPEQERRLALARWIADPPNPLAARVIVNRLWQHHFGIGLVETPSDFGLNGARPSHPELLDWLANELIAGGWRLKSIHRLILLSSAYRQDSRPHPRALALDAQNQRLWRFSPRRLEAEPLRDSILFVSGNLDLAMGGPGFDLFEPNNNYVKVYNPKRSFGPAEWRRMIYQSKPRMRLDDTFGAFDCPDAGQATPRRSSSTTPLQALNLLNAPFMIQQAQMLAHRLQTEVGARSPDQVVHAFRLVFSREPDATELMASLNLVGQHGLITLCRCLLNANEFLYVQ